ncbi:hypothetical protein SKAU_G00125140 [Synaphobranchus kaupii]|uniref:Uncharacterized protein n=1 Tax=Synaphobranchus kaupii TaxID=118154 RepID=A0A9Q1FQ57_SYNKA|nr:hypothetical protein SKAU_G00125140 [Synaphobranchus kaupii]
MLHDITAQSGVWGAGREAPAGEAVAMRRPWQPPPRPLNPTQTPLAPNWRASPSRRGRGKEEHNIRTVTATGGARRKEWRLSGRKWRVDVVVLSVDIVFNCSDSERRDLLPVTQSLFPRDQRPPCYEALPGLHELLFGDRDNCGKFIRNKACREHILVALEIVKRNPTGLPEPR